MFTILSDADKQVNIYASLFKKCSSASHYAGRPEKLESDIRRIGLFEARLAISENATRNSLIATLGKSPSHGRSHRSGWCRSQNTNVVLGNAFGLDEGIVVDTRRRRR